MITISKITYYKNLEDNIFEGVVYRFYILTLFLLCLQFSN